MALSAKRRKELGLAVVSLSEKKRRRAGADQAAYIGAIRENAKKRKHARKLGIPYNDRAHNLRPESHRAKPPRQIPEQNTIDKGLPFKEIYQNVPLSSKNWCGIPRPLTRKA